MSTPCYPDAYIKDGLILDITNDQELPSYSGMVLANLAGRFAILYTTLNPDRDFDLVHWGSSLSTVEIQQYLQKRKAQ